MRNLTAEQSQALKRVVRAKLVMWDAAMQAETSLDRDIDTSGEELDYLCALIDKIEDADKLTDEDLIRAFSL